MDQDVLPLSQTAEEKGTGSIVPPATPEAYWLTPYGSPGPGSTNTTYIIGHSWEGRSSAFNNISTQAKLGDQLMLTTAKWTLSYEVTAITTENKETLRASGIWAKVPGRLIIISCYTEDLWGTNIIIEASPLEARQR
jgi:sortase (surface protein transpeptidase)